MPCCFSLAAIWSMPNENTFAKPRSRYTCSRGCEVGVVVCALQMPIDSPSSNIDSTRERGRCQRRRTRRENRRDLVQPPKAFMAFPQMEPSFSPLEFVHPLNSYCLRTIRSFNGGYFGGTLISTSVLRAQHLGPLGAFHGCCLYCRSQVGLIGCYWLAFKGID